MEGRKKDLIKNIAAWEEVERELEIVMREMHRCNYGLAQERVEVLYAVVRVYGSAARQFLNEKNQE